MEFWLGKESSFVRELSYHQVEIPVVTWGKEKGGWFRGATWQALECLICYSFSYCGASIHYHTTSGSLPSSTGSLLPCLRLSCLTNPSLPSVVFLFPKWEKYHRPASMPDSSLYFLHHVVQATLFSLHASLYFVIHFLNGFQLATYHYYDSIIVEKTQLSEF